MLAFTQIKQTPGSSHFCVVMSSILFGHLKQVMAESRDLTLQLK